MKRVIKNNYKFILGIIVGLIISITTVYAVDAYIESNKVAYNNYNKTNVEEAIDELYEKSGVHKDNWIDPILNGADPVLKAPLIPVEIKPNGEVYYANEKSEWYNYSEKKWANAVILIDNPSNTNYQVGDHIIEDDIESYFVWIPRYQYKIWDMGNYAEIIDSKILINNDYDTSLRQAIDKSRIIDIKFGSVANAPKMAESDAAVGKYYTHPAFTLGDKDLNGIWVGKFETGYKGAKNVAGAQINREEHDNVIVKPNVYSWRYISIKNMFMTSYNYKRDLDSHMLKNTEWGAITYLSHSEYGIGSKININNASDYKTGYSAVAGTDRNAVPGKGDSADSSDNTKTKPWNTTTGFLASTTGNISGVYDMSGGTLETMAACVEGSVGSSDFDIETLAKEMDNGYIDRYSKDSTSTSFNKRILGDAIGELGPFYTYIEGNGSLYLHSSWYSNSAEFVRSAEPWLSRGSWFDQGAVISQFYFRTDVGEVWGAGFRVALAPT